MIKRYTTVARVTNDVPVPSVLVNICTEAVTHAIPYGTNPDNELEMLGITLSDGTFHLVYGTEIGLNSAIEDLTVSL